MTVDAIATLGPQIAAAWTNRTVGNLGWAFRMVQDRGQLERSDGFTVTLRPDAPGRIVASVLWPYDDNAWCAPARFIGRDAVDPRASAATCRPLHQVSDHLWRNVTLPGLSLWPACQDWHAARRLERRQRTEVARECGMIAGREPHKVGGDDLYLSHGSQGGAGDPDRFHWQMRVMEGGAVEVRGTFGRNHADALAHCFTEIEEAAKRAAKEDA